MRSFLRNHKKLTAVLGFVALLVALEVWSVTAPMRGRMAARLDLWQGHYRILSYGLPPSWFPEYARLLKDRYVVELHPVAGCIVSNGLVSYVDSYDGVSVAAINHKFGHDVFKECTEDARKAAHMPSSISQSAREDFLDGDFTIITKVDALPEPVLRALTERGDSRSLMANPGDKFEATDVISDPSLPQMRLIFAGVGNGKSFAHYEQGGRAHMFIVALFNSPSSRSAELTWRGYCYGPANNLAALRSKLANGGCQ